MCINASDRSPKNGAAMENRSRCRQCCRILWQTEAHIQWIFAVSCRNIDLVSIKGPFMTSRDSESWCCFQRACLSVCLSVCVCFNKPKSGSTLCLKKVPIMASCSFDKHGMSTQRIQRCNFCKTDVRCWACLGGAVGSVTVRAAWLRWSARPGSRPGLARSLCQVIAAYALRLNSRARTEGSTVSSLICDRWLMLGLETLSISRCLNNW